jgi:hypothetical protein
MPDPTPAKATGMSIAFTNEDVMWLHWAMTSVLREHDTPAKEKILKAYDLLVMINKVGNDAISKSADN